MRRYGKIVTLLAFLLVFLILVACSKGGDVETTEGTTDTIAEGTTAPAGTDEPDEKLSIPLDALKEYRIVYPRSGTDSVAAQVMALQSAIEDAYGVSLEVRDDFTRPGTVLAEAECEILVGLCERTQSETFCGMLRSKDYGYAVIDKKLVIAGGSPESTVRAIEAFLLNEAKGGGEVFFSNEDQLLRTFQHDVDPVYLNGVPLGRYRIVYPANDANVRGAANYLAARWEEAFCYRLPVRDDSSEEAEYEILLGATSRDVAFAGGESYSDSEYLIAAGEKRIWLAGRSSTTIYRAIEGLDEKFTEREGGGALELSLSGTQKGTYDSALIRVMSYNIRCGEFTEARIELVFRMIDLYAPDTVGFQEVTVEWMDLLKARLGDRYGYVGVGRNADHSGEASPVFYLKSRFELVDGGTKWMTDTPDVAGSKIPESSLPRVFSYAELRSIETGRVFVHVNTHLEHTSEEAREIQAGHLVSFLEGYRQRGLSYVVTGDFNCESGAGSYNVMLDSGLRNAMGISEKAIEGTTYHGYGKTSKVIDHIFVTPSVGVKFYKACTETFKYSDGSIAYPSDHNPVIADCEM